jgi:Trk K+ transport system NAD-binding subunit
MPTAIIGVGRIGTAVATHLTEGGESVVLAASTPAPAEQLARELCAAAHSASAPPPETGQRS